jgi:hypothetical protein
MKKAACAILSIALVFSLSACQSKAKPEDTVKGYFEAEKASDTTKASTFVNPKNASSEASSPAASDSEEADLEKDLIDYLKGNNKKVEYTIKSTDEKDSSATVTVDCKFVDAAPMFKDSITDYISKAFAKAFTDSASSDDSEKEITKLMKSRIKTTKETFASKTIKVNCVKIDEKWYIDKVNDDLQNVFSSNLVNAGNEISKSFGGTGSSRSASSSAESSKEKLNEISDYITDDIWNKGFCDIDSYVKTGKSSTGESLDIDFTLQQLDSSMKKKADYDSYVSKLDDSKYSSIKSIWTKLSGETDSLYKNVKAKKPVANSSSTFDTGKFEQYMQAFSDAADKLE